MFVLPSTGFELTHHDTLQHHSLSPTSSALDHSTTFPFKTLYKGNLWTLYLQFCLTNANSFTCFS